MDGLAVWGRLHAQAYSFYTDVGASLTQLSNR